MKKALDMAVFVSLILSFIIISCTKKSNPLVPGAGPTATTTAMQTHTITITVIPSGTFTPTETVTETCTDTSTATITPTVTETLTSTLTDTLTMTPSITPTHSVSPTYSPTFTITLTLTFTSTPTAVSFGEAAYPDVGYGIIETSDNGFLAFGDVLRSPANNDFCLRINPARTPIWQIAWPTPTGMGLYSGTTMSSGNYKFVGFNGACPTPPLPCGSAAAMTEINTTGTIVSTYPNYISGYRAYFIKNSGTGFLITGNDSSGGGTIMRMNASSNNFYRPYGDAGESAVFYSAIEPSGGDIMAAGSSTKPGGGIIIIRTDSTGNTVTGWPKNFDGYGRNCTVLDTGGMNFILAASTASSGGDGTIIITDTDGNYVNSATYGTSGTDLFNKAVLLGDGSIVACGESEGNVWAIKIASDLGVIWNKTYYPGVANAIISTSDGGFALTGSVPALNGNLFIMKLDANGNRVW